MAFKRISAIAFLADYVSDLKALPKSPMGAECHIIENAAEYKCNSKGEWILQSSKVSSSIDLSNYYTKSEVDDKVEQDLNDLALSTEELLEILK